MKKFFLLASLVFISEILTAQFKVDLSANVLFPGKTMADSPVYLNKGYQLGIGVSYRWKKLEAGAEVIQQTLSTDFSAEMKKQGFYNSSMIISSARLKQMIFGVKGKWYVIDGGGIQLHAGMITAGDNERSTLKNGSSGVYNTFYPRNDHTGFVIQPGLFYDLNICKQISVGLHAGYSISGTKYTVYTEPYTPPSIPPGQPQAYEYKQQFFQLGISVGYNFKGKKDSTKTRALIVPTTRSFAITGFPGQKPSTSANTISRMQLEDWSKEFVTKAGDEYKAVSLDTADGVSYLSIHINESATNKQMNLFLPLQEKDGDILLIPMPGGGTTVALCFGSKNCDNCRPTKNMKSCYCVATPKFVNVCQELMVGPIKYKDFGEFLLKRAEGQ